MLPAEEWWGILEASGVRVWPAQAVYFCGGALIVLMVFARPGRVANALVRVYVALSLGWIGVVLKGAVSFALFLSLWRVCFWWICSERG